MIVKILVRFLNTIILLPYPVLSGICSNWRFMACYWFKCPDLLIIKYLYHGINLYPTKNSGLIGDYHYSLSWPQKKKINIRYRNKQICSK